MEKLSGVFGVRPGIEAGNGVRSPVTPQCCKHDPDQMIGMFFENLDELVRFDVSSCSVQTERTKTLKMTTKSLNKCSFLKICN